MPDSPRKMAFIEEILRSLRGLRTDTTINSHFVILSSLVVQNQVIEEEEEREAPSKNENE